MPRHDCGWVYPVYDCQHCPDVKEVLCGKCGELIVVKNEYHVRNGIE